MEDLTTKPLVDIVKELSQLEQEIYYKTMRYNALVAESIRRFPTLAKDIKPKEICDEGNTKGSI